VGKRVTRDMRCEDHGIAAIPAQVVVEHLGRPDVLDRIGQQAIELGVAGDQWLPAAVAIPARPIFIAMSWR
jgi:hypothetical protein